MSWKLNYKNYIFVAFECNNLQIRSDVIAASRIFIYLYIRFIFLVAQVYSCEIVIFGVITRISILCLTNDNIIFYYT